jgi:hypothetical protein
VALGEVGAANLPVVIPTRWVQSMARVLFERFAITVDGMVDVFFDQKVLQIRKEVMDFSLVARLEEHRIDL